MKIEVGTLSNLLRLKDSAITKMMLGLRGKDMMKLVTWQETCEKETSPYDKVCDTLVKKYSEKGKTGIQPGDPNWVIFEVEIKSINKVVSVPAFPFTQKRVVEMIEKEKLDISGFAFKDLIKFMWIPYKEKEEDK